jgi:hypothetical protein
MVTSNGGIPRYPQTHPPEAAKVPPHQALQNEAGYRYVGWLEGKNGSGKGQW